MNSSNFKPKITFKDVSCAYGSTIAIDNVNMQIQPNNITAFIGPSGCGKTTVLRSLNRMNDTIPGSSIGGEIYISFDDEPEPRDIYNNGIDIVSLRRKVGMVFQRPNPFPITIYENICYGPRLFGVNKKSELDQIVEQSLRCAVLWEEVKDKLHSSTGLDLSGGQQQRLCIARALAVGPEVLLLDEPCSALDPVATVKVEDLLIDLKKDLTIVIVTHNMQQASRISDRTALFWVNEQNRHGELVEYKPTIELFSNPQDQRTEGYITGRFG
ncbi:MAG: phosphate ABC transporter ATP-binding protein PstB [Candidatus Caenarcaniphilales bacterium]|nr:phosphate ABC transporter ATP-binding protein PstB [Candidatus Caenarcaniphilales bacterium]